MLDIIKGHLNEMFNLEDELSKERLEICKNCPLFLEHNIKGWICNPSLWLNAETGESNESYKEGMVKGCGCRLKAKTRLVDAHCPCKKW